MGQFKEDDRKDSSCIDWRLVLDDLVDRSGCWVTGNGGSSGVRTKNDDES